MNSRTSRILCALTVPLVLVVVFVPLSRAQAAKISRGALLLPKDLLSLPSRVLGSAMHASSVKPAAGESVQAACTITFTYTTVDVPGSVNTFAGGINNSGQIVGGYQSADLSRHGFLFFGSVFTIIDDPLAASGSEATGINNLGQIVGAYDLNSPEEGHVLEGAHGFSRDSGGTFTTIDFPGASTTTPHKVNDSGEIVGIYRVAGAEAHGFTDNGGVLAPLDFPGTFSTQDNGINNSGLIVGRYRLTNGAPKQGFLDNGGTFTTIDFPGAATTVVTDINNFGDIVGFYKLSDGTEFGFLNRGGAFCPSIAFPGAIATEVFGINDQGNIVGAYADQAGLIHGFEASPVATPTPTNTPTLTPIPPTNTLTPIPPTATNTPVPPTATNTPTLTPIPPTNTRTLTPIPPTATNTAVPPTATNTPKPPPFGGSFVIGDGNSTIGTNVTFWGAQWSTLNSLSGGSAPAAFKGFAENPAKPSCGTNWSSDPGNSAAPPPAPLPAYMAVIVASSISRSGSTISGNTLRMVIVQTNPGYAPNPGNAGTGKVVAILCP